MHWKGTRTIFDSPVVPDVWAQKQIFDLSEIRSEIVLDLLIHNFSIFSNIV